MQADLALHERMEQRMMAKVRAAEQALLDGEFSILNSSPLGRAQVERFAALNARIQELESMHGVAPAMVLLLIISDLTLLHLFLTSYQAFLPLCQCIHYGCHGLNCELCLGSGGIPASPERVCLDFQSTFPAAAGKHVTAHVHRLHVSPASFSSTKVRNLE